MASGSVSKCSCTASAENPPTREKRTRLMREVGARVRVNFVLKNAGIHELDPRKSTNIEVVASLVCVSSPPTYAKPRRNQSSSGNSASDSSRSLQKSGDA